MLAGGIGSRFWPLSTPSRPKQILPLAGERPLIVDTVERAHALVGNARLRILAGPHLTEAFRSALPDLGEENFLVEPEARGTSPVLAWAAWEIARRDPSAVLVSLHADHVIRPVEGFVRTVRAAARVAVEEDALVTIGVSPDRVETGYGHIQPGGGLAARDGVDAFRVAAFHEKPDPPTAERYVRDGYLWNTGIFVWKAETFLSEVERHAPEVGSHLPLLAERGSEAFFRAAPRCVVDRAVLERSDRVACVRAAFAWDDVGSWAALPRVRPTDDAGNVVVGSGEVVEGGGNVLVADQGRIIVWGMDDVTVVRTKEVTLVLPRERAADLKTLLRTLGEAT